MAKKQKVTFEYRHYELPQELPILALLGDSWIRKYEKLGALHFHNHLEIGYCYWGTGNLYIEDRTNRFGPGTFTFIPKNIPHTTESDGESMAKWEYLFVDLESLLSCYTDSAYRYVQPILEMVNTKAFCLNDRDHPDMARFLLKIIEEMRAHSKYYQHNTRNLMLSWLMEIGRFEEFCDETELVPTGKGNIQIVPALEYISEQYQRTIKISDLAALCHMSETHFRRVFQHIMAMAPLDYINTVRIHNACALLKGTQDSVLAVAIKTGFSTITTFNRNFYKLMGTTPLKWRNDPSNMEKSLRNYNIKRLEGWF